MLCRAGCTPVLNDDQATGEIDGYVVFNRRYAPVFASREKFGRMPSFMNWSVSLGSWPSSPTKISRLMDDRGAVRPRARRHSARNGHARIDAMAMTIVVKMTRNDPRTAKPAPGPMYASARAGRTSRTHAASARRDITAPRLLTIFEIDL